MKDEIDSILVIKHQRLLHLKSRDKIIKTYTIALGKEPIGTKEFEGDNKTPEGEYIIYQKTERSEFYKSLGISYPNEKEKTNAKKIGKKGGGQIRIHGFKSEFKGDQKGGKNKDWTAGCIAVTNAEIDEIYGLVEVGIRIIIQQ